jgi:hypothetical protein
MFLFERNVCKKETKNENWKKQLKFAKLYKFEIYAKTFILREKASGMRKTSFYGPNNEK